MINPGLKLAVAAGAALLVGPPAFAANINVPRTISANTAVNLRDYVEARLCNSIFVD